MYYLCKKYFTLKDKIILKIIIFPYCGLLYVFHSSHFLTLDSCILQKIFVCERNFIRTEYFLYEFGFCDEIYILKASQPKKYFLIRRKSAYD